jgi:hypothetical protein
MLFQDKISLWIAALTRTATMARKRDVPEQDSPGCAMGVGEPVSAQGDLPDFEYGQLHPVLFRELILGGGAVMLRNAVDRRILDRIERSLSDLFERYADVPASEFEHHLASSDPEERDFWEQIKRSHVFDRTFKSAAGISYFDIIRNSGLSDFAACAFPESEITESAVCNCRRIADSELHQLWDKPIEFHIDAQVFYDDRLSINFWTPLVPCGVDAPGLKVIMLGVDETKAYLEYSVAGYVPGPNDIALMHKFRCRKMELPELEKNDLLKHVWAPEFNLGDVLAFTNFTMHATHYTQLMSRPRASVEVRIDLSGYSLD